MISEKATSTPNVQAPIPAHQPQQPAEVQNAYPQAHSQQVQQQQAHAAEPYAASQPATYAIPDPPRAPSPPQPKFQAIPVLALIVGIPAALFAVHAGAFGLDGSWGLGLLVAVGAGVAAFIYNSSQFRAKTSTDLLKQFLPNKVAVRICVALIVAAELPAVHMGVSSFLRNRRLDSVFEASDPCLEASREDMWEASPVRRNTINIRKAQCEKKKAIAATEAKAKRCAEAVAHTQSGTLTNDDKASLGLALDVAGHIAQKAISGDDLARTTKGLSSCEGFWAVYVKAAMDSVDVWSKLPSGQLVHADLRAEFGKGTKLSQEAAQGFEQHVDDAAATAARNAKTSEDAAAATSLCALATEVKAPARPSCVYLAARVEQLRKAETAADNAKKALEEAKAKKEAAAEEGKSKRCDAENKMHEFCLERCAQRYGENYPCDSACAARYPTPSCN